MPDVVSAVAGYAMWPDEPFGWTRHFTPDGRTVYPKEDHESEGADTGGRTARW